MKGLPATATLDTNIADSVALAELALSRGVAVLLVTTTERELEGSDVRAVPAGRITETGTFGEGLWGSAVYASKREADLFEQVLSIISNSSFPSPEARESLSGGQRRQLRDAMILMAHVRERRDVFVSNDVRGFICDGRRERLEALLGTKILTASEFTDLLGSA